MTSEKPSILIVEDVVADIDILQHILKNHFVLHIAKTGEAALGMAVEHNPDLILLDIILPDMTGFAVLQELKNSVETQGIPVIIITGINNVQYEEKGLTDGAVDYITKPFHNTVVLARIRTQIQVIQYIRTIEQLGMVDAVTGLANARSFEKQIALEWARAVREKTTLSLLMIDIDQFDDFNAVYGRPSGDALLDEMAKLISGELKRPADFAARLDQNMLAVLLPNTVSDGVTKIAEEIRSKARSITVTTQADPITGPVTLSMGIATTQPASDSSVNDMRALAEELLREARDFGGDRICAAAV